MERPTRALGGARRVAEVAPPNLRHRSRPARRPYRPAHALGAHALGLRNHWPQGSDLAARLEGLTKNGEVIIDNFTRSGTTDLIQAEPLPPLQPKGRVGRTVPCPYVDVCVRQIEK